MTNEKWEQTLQSLSLIRSERLTVDEFEELKLGYEQADIELQKLCPGAKIFNHEAAQVLKHGN